MSTLYLICGLCGHKQANGLLSRAHWGHVDTAAGTLRACPRCKAEHRDWASRLGASAERILQGRTFTDAQASAYAGSYDKP